MSDVDEQMAEALEQIRCAEINLDNVIGAVPFVQAHPFYKIARFQLCEARQRLGDLGADADGKKWVGE